jgi:hypothetical protein
MQHERRRLGAQNLILRGRQKSISPQVAAPFNLRRAVLGAAANRCRHLSVPADDLSSGAYFPSPAGGQVVPLCACPWGPKAKKTG